MQTATVSAAACHNRGSLRRFCIIERAIYSHSLAYMAYNRCGGVKLPYELAAMTLVKIAIRRL